MPATDLGQTLLALARQAIAHRLGRAPAPIVPADPRLHEKGTTFVTLTKDGELREYVMTHYLLLYARIKGSVYLLSIRHQRQLSFDFQALWPTGN